MLSKNNFKEKIRKMETKKQRYSIRKFSVGVASVLIGFSFMTYSKTAKADVVNSTQEVAVNTTKNTEQQATSSTADSTADTKQAEKATSQATSSASSSAASSAASATSSSTSASQSTANASSAASLSSAATQIGGVERATNHPTSSPSSASDKASEAAKATASSSESSAAKAASSASTRDNVIVIKGVDPSDPIYNRAKNLINKNDSQYIYSIVRLNGATYAGGQAVMILAMSRTNPGQYIHAYVTNTSYNSIDPTNNDVTILVDNDPTKGTNWKDINVNGKIWRVHNTGIYNLLLQGTPVQTQGATNIQVLDTATTSTRNIYGLGAQTETNFTQKVDIDPALSIQDALKYYIFKDGKYEEYTDENTPRIEVTGLSGQKFTIKNINSYKKVIQKYYLTNGESLVNTNGTDYTGTISLFQPNRYYKKVLYNGNSATISQTILFHEVPNSEGLYDGTMEASLYTGNSVNVEPVETLTLDPGQSKQFTNGTYARNPYIANDVNVATLKYNPLGYLVAYDKYTNQPILDENGNPIKVQYNNSTDPTMAADTKSPVIEGYTLVNPSDRNYNPTSPGKDHTVYYQKVESSAEIKYIDDTTGKTLGIDDTSGKYDEPIIFDLDPNAAIKDYEKQGYVLVSNNYSNDSIFGTTPAKFEVHLKHGVTKVDPENPGEPDKPLNSEYPDGPKYPLDSANVTNTVTRTINYVYARNNQPIEGHQPVVQEAKFSAEGYLDKVTGEWVTVDENNNVTGVKADGLTWSPENATLSEVESPELDGYNADHLVIAATTIDHTSANIVETVKYVHTENATFIYRDLTDNKDLGTPVTVSGDYDSIIRYNPANTINNFVKAGYVLVNNPYRYGTTKYGDTNDNPDVNTFIITFKHGVENVEENREVTRTIKYLYEDNSTAAPTYTDKVTFTGTGYKDKVTGNFVTVDDKGDIVDKNSQLEWTPASGTFETVKSPEITGYSPNQLEIVAKEVLPTSADIEEEVIYLNNEQAAQIDYWDDLTGKNLGSDAVNGSFGKEINFHLDPKKVIEHLESQGYQLVVGKGNYDPDKTYTYSHDNNDNIFNVYFTHTTEPVETTKDVTRTINYEYSDGKTASPSVTQTTRFVGKGTKDKVTGELVNLDSSGNIVVNDGEIEEGSYTWTPESFSFDEVRSPEISNYTPSQEVVTQLAVKPTDEDSIVNVVYIPTEQTARIIYRDITTNKTLHTDLVKGTYGAEINYSTANDIKKFEDKGYELVSDDFVPGTKYDTSENNIFYVLLKHGVTKVDPENPGEPGTPINPNDPEGPKYPLDSANLTKDITRTVNYKYSDGSQAAPSKKDTLHFQATGVIDKVTGEYVILDNQGNIRVDENKVPLLGNLIWTSNGNSFARVDSPTIVGYTPDQAYINEINGITESSPDSEFNVTYFANNENAKVIYIDDVTGTTLRTDSTFGKYGDAINFTDDPQNIIANYEKQGYLQVDKPSFTFENGKTTYQDSSNNEAINTYTVHLTHATVPVGPDDDFTPDTPINPEDPEGPTYPFDATTLKRTVTQTIDYIYQNTGATAAPSKVTTLTFEGRGIIDKVTGQLVQVEDGKIKVDNDGNILPGVITWTSDGTSFATVVSPKIKGYTPDKDEIASVDNVTADSGNLYETVVYAANMQQAQIQYIDKDENNKILATDAISGTYGSVITFNTDPADAIIDYEAKGYVLDSSDYKQGATFQEDNKDNLFKVYFVHGTTPIDPENPGKPDDPINPEDPDGPKYPADTAATDLTKTVTRTINYVYKENGATAAPSKTQTLTFTASGVLDKVTGQWVTPLTWKPAAGIFKEVSSPEISGYTPDQATVGAENNITNNSNNIEITVTYTQDSETPATPDVPVIPDQPNVPLEPDTPTIPEEPSIPTKPGTPNKPGSSIIPSKPNNVYIQPVNIDNTISIKENSYNVKKYHNKKVLPQTGIKNENLLGLIGLVLASVGVIAFLKEKDRK